MEEARKLKEQNIDKLLVLLNDEIEESGKPIGCAEFNLDENDNELLSIFGDSDTLRKTVYTCVTRGYLKYLFLGAHDLTGLVMTEEGQCRAISVINQKEPEPSAPSISIGQITNNGPSQIGNNNVQTITNILTQLMNQVDQTDATEDEKKDFKSKVNAVLSHPLINTLVSAGAGIAGALL
ncbi:hypothetical protein [Treponema sp.]|uniref:hypothetical protein n=1 Tax=Treponema sp. TaxID=166 RepID=UPI003FD709B7